MAEEKRGTGKRCKNSKKIQEKQFYRRFDIEELFLFTQLLLWLLLLVVVVVLVGNSLTYAVYLTATLFPPPGFSNSLLFSAHPRPSAFVAAAPQRC